MTQAIDAAQADCPRWYVKVRLPASLDDPRGVFEIPAPLFATPTSAEAVEVTVDPDDPTVAAVFDVLSAASKSGAASILEVTFCGHRLKLNPSMREELLTAVTAFLAGVSLECKVETQPFAALN
jgi:hypothetical protein